MACLALLPIVPAGLRAADYALGADVSFLKQAEDQGAVFKDNGQAKPGLQLLKDHGYNWVRLRLFHSPTRLPNDLPYTLALAQDARKRGFFDDDNNALPVVGVFDRFTRR